MQNIIETKDKEIIDLNKIVEDKNTTNQNLIKLIKDLEKKYKNKYITYITYITLSLI